MFNKGPFHHLFPTLFSQLTKPSDKSSITFFSLRYHSDLFLLFFLWLFLFENLSVCNIYKIKTNLPELNIEIS